jgi:YHS domain-containing protein
VFGLIGWVGRFLLILFVIRWIMSLFFPVRTQQQRPAGPRGPFGGFGGAKPPAERVGGQLVRDPQCGTYIPEAKSIKFNAAGATLHFCSETCCAEYRTAHPAA